MMERIPEATWRVFISHSAQDTWVAKCMAKEMTLVGATPFLDESNIAIGENIEDIIKTNIRVAKELVVYLTPWALERPYVWMEFGASRILDIPRIVVLHGLQGVLCLTSLMFSFRIPMRMPVGQNLSQKNLRGRA